MPAPPPHFRRGFIRTRRAAMALAAASLVLLCRAESTTAGHEAEVKAAALFNVVTFTEWPESAFGSPESDLVVGVLGPSPTAAELASIVTRETCRGRRLILRPVSVAADVRGCHVLLVAGSELERWRKWGPQIARLPVLTISDADGFAARGGMVQLAIQDKRLRLIVNLPAARAAGLLISSKVLRLAHVIDDRAP